MRLQTLAIFTAIGAGIAFAGSPAQNDTADNNGGTTNVVTADSVADNQSTIELIKANRRIRELTDSLATLKDAFDTAFPYAEFCIMTGDDSTGNGDFSTIDLTTAEQEAEALKRLSPYSVHIKSRYDRQTRLIEIVERYNELTQFDNEPYSERLVNETANSLLELYDYGQGIINAAQSQQIDSLYVKADTYRHAVESFAGVITDVDTQVAQFRDNDAADRLCIEEIDNVMTNSQNAIADINRYRLLAKLFEEYTAELRKAPRSTTDAIRAQIKNMLAPAGSDISDDNQ